MIVNTPIPIDGAHIASAGDGAALLAIDHYGKLEITRVHARPPGDATFPAIDPSLWREAARRDYPAGPQDEASFTITTYIRQHAA